MSSRKESERRLIASARRVFGQHLTAFLLSGFGETKVTRSRTIKVEPGKAGAKLVINSVTAHPGGLPRGDDPLVLLALLRLWLDRGLSPLGHLSYCYEEVFGLLGWESSERSKAVADEAVLRYFGLIYHMEYEECELVISASDKVMTGYSFWDETVDAPEPVSRVFREVRFNKDFLKELKGRKIIGIDWRKVKSLVA